MNKQAASLALAALILVGAGCNQTAPVTPEKPTPIPPPEIQQAPTPAPEPTPEPKPEPLPDPKPPVSVEGELKVFTVTAGNFKYDVDKITVNKGDKVRIVFKNTEGLHDLVIDEFSAATKKIGAPAEETIEFVADKSGSFEYYCSVGKHRQMGMKGALIVK